MTAKNTVLVLPFTRSILEDPTPILSLVYKVVQESVETCTILFSTPASSSGDGDLYPKLKAEPRRYWDTFQRFLGKIYATLSAAQWSAGRVLLDVEVGFEGYDLHDRFGGREGVKEINLQAYLNLPIIMKLRQVLVGHTGYTVPTATLDLSSVDKDNESKPPNVPLTSSASAAYPTTALGGTFDHLHAAHKLLLHLSLFLTSSKLIVGVMTPSLLQSKSNSQLLQSLDDRIRNTKSFLSRQGTSIELDVVEIHDPFGPTAWDGDIQALVVSRETLSGGEAVNKKRKEKGLGELDVWVIDVIAAEHASTLDNDQNLGKERGEGGGEGIKTRDLSHVDDEGELKALKMGSTAIRQWIKDHRNP